MVVRVRSLARIVRGSFQYGGRNAMFTGYAGSSASLLRQLGGDVSKNRNTISSNVTASSTIVQQHQSLSTTKGMPLPLQYEETK